MGQQEFFTQMKQRSTELQDRGTILTINPEEVYGRLTEFATMTDEGIVAEGNEPFWTAGTTGELYERLKGQIYTGLDEIDGNVSLPDMIDWLYEVADSLAEPGNRLEEQAAVNIIGNFSLVIPTVFGVGLRAQTGRVTDPLESGSRDFAIMEYGIQVKQDRFKAGKPI